MNATHRSYPYWISAFNNRHSCRECPFARLSKKSVNMHRFQVLWNVHQCADACLHMWIITYEARWSVSVNVLYIVETNYCVTWFLFAPITSKQVHTKKLWPSWKRRFWRLSSNSNPTSRLNIKGSRAENLLRPSKCVKKYNLKCKQTYNKKLTITFE